jgi:hypothetical protein
MNVIYSYAVWISNIINRVVISTDLYSEGLVFESDVSDKAPWPESASELYRPSDRRLSAKLVPTFADRRWHVVSVTDPYGRHFGFLDQKLKYEQTERKEKKHGPCWYIFNCTHSPVKFTSEQYLF